jgi:amidase
MPAVEQLKMMRDGEITCAELLELQIQRTERVNPTVNAVVTKTFDAARERAAEIDRSFALCGPDGQAPPLHGLTVAHKDTLLTRGVRTTHGSPLYAEHVPDTDASIVESYAHAGAITVGKTNTPEFGAGSQTYNRVFGTTFNPYDLALTCGGSSGGGAAALACGMVALADGTDMGGSLRNPASFCNVVGLRPSPGAIAAWPAADAWDPLNVQGPMGRVVADVAMQFGALAGPDPRAPLSGPGPPAANSLERDLKGTRVAWSENLGGLPMEPAVTEVLEVNRPVLQHLGCNVVDVEPDLRGAEEVFTVWRALSFDLNLGHHYDEQPDALGDDVRWNIERGRELTSAVLVEAQRRRTELFHRMRLFFEQYEFLVAPVAQVLPFSASCKYPEKVNGMAIETYIDWMKSCYVISAASLPAVSVPFGFSSEGLPVGLQVVGAYGQDWSVLQMAHAIERETQLWRQPPKAVS